MFLEMMRSIKVMSFMMTAIMMTWKWKFPPFLVKIYYIRHLDVLFFDRACFSHCVCAMVTEPMRKNVVNNKNGSCSFFELSIYFQLCSNMTNSRFIWNNCDHFYLNLVLILLILEMRGCELSIFKDIYDIWGHSKDIWGHSNDIWDPFKIFNFTWCGHRPKAGKLQMNQSPCLVWRRNEDLILYQGGSAQW